MKRKLFKTLTAAISLVAVFAGTGLAFTEGKDYQLLETPIPNAENTLIKVFSYDCPFCYKYDKSVTPKVVDQLSADVTFRPFHLKTKGTYGELGTKLFAVLLAKDQANGLSDKDINGDKSLLKKAKMAYYEAYHDKKERWDAGEEAFLKTGLDAVGMSKAEFEEGLNDPQAQALIAEWEASYEVAKIQGIPGFVVNGKYLIVTKSIKSVDGMLQLVNELLKK